VDTSTKSDNAAPECFFGVLKREHVNRLQYRTRTQARADIFDYIERFYNSLKKRRLEALEQKELPLTKPTVETG